MTDRYGYGDSKPSNPSAAASGTQLKDIKKRLPLRILSPADWEHWTRWGYVVVRDAAPPENVARMRDILWEFMELDPKNPDSWLRPQMRDHEMLELNQSGMVEIYNHQYMWDNRQLPRIYAAFVDIWDREDLWVTIDRANMNPPNHGVRKFDGFIHTDVDNRLDPLPINCQGVLALVDSDPEMGGFQCVPELFRTLEDWRKTQAPDRNGFKPDITGFEIVNVNLKAGELLIFNSLLAHGIRPNRSKDRVRMAQYISMTPADEGNEELRQWRIKAWRDREPARGYAFPGDPREWEKKRYARAVLSELGEKLLGLKSWM